MVDRFEAKVEKGEGCWLWTGQVAPGGYGLFATRGRKNLAHRVAWERENGRIPEGQYVCHSCDTRRCVRGDHLFLGSPAENVADMIAKGRFVNVMRHAGLQREKTECPQGHPFNAENTGRYGSGWRYCKECKRTRARDRKRRLRAPRTENLVEVED